ncbi:MAG: flavin reductase family protein [Candidatus Eremiobacteraeota bacterium]|nr:flavin reductase family protein [Candidatus Eremiobacteraeota bacterium]
MDKIKLGKHAFPYPMPMVVLGTMVGGKVNYMAVGWVSRVNYSPPMIGVALGKVHHTNKGIKEHRQFGLSIPSLDLIREVDYTGIVSGAKTDKSGMFQTFFGDLPFAPMVKECPLAMECKVVEVVELPSNELFIAEITESYSEERFLSEGKPDVKKINPFVLTMPDNGYWQVGEYAGKAWSIGKELKKL